MIRLHSVEISRFRGVREGKVSELKDVNLLIGKNNSGKTTVVEAIGRATGGNDVIGRDVSMVTSLSRNEKEVLPEGVAWRLDWDNSPMVELQIGLDDGQQVRRRATFSKTGVKRLVGIKTPLVAPVSTQFDRFLKYPTVFAANDAYNNEIERAVWEPLLKQRRDKFLVQALNTIFGSNIEGLNLLPNGKLLVLYPDTSLPVDYQGDGMRAALRCLMILASLQGTVMAIEEPECRQHPAALRRLASGLCELARMQQVQLVITTHSLECARAFMQASTKAGSEGAVFHLKLKDGLLESLRLDDETVQTLDATGVDVRSLDLFV